MAIDTNWQVTANSLGLALALTSDRVTDVFEQGGGFLVIVTEKAFYNFGVNDEETAHAWQNPENDTQHGESSAVTLGQLGRDIALWLDTVEAN